MKIQQHLQSRGLRARDAFFHVVQIAVFRLVAVGPKTDADQIGAVILEDRVDVFDHAVVAIGGAAIVHFIREGQVAAEIGACGHRGRG
jgi:hypothetical protein